MNKSPIHIKQKSNWDCCIASIAMLTDMSYEEVLELFKKLFPRKRSAGLTDDEVFKILKSLKQTPKLLNAVIANIPAILYLPSKNEVGSHAVYFDGKEIFDPNFRVKGKKYYGKKIPKKFPSNTQSVVNMKNPSVKKAVKKLEKLNNG